MENKDNFLLFFRSEDPEAVHFVESDRFKSWFEHFGQENFIGAVRARRLDDCYDIIGLFLDFLGEYIFHAEKTRAVKGDPDKIEAFLHSKLGGLITFYNGAESFEEWKEKSRENRITGDLKT